MAGRVMTDSEIGKLTRIISREMGLPVTLPNNAANLGGAAGGNVGIAEQTMTKKGADGDGNSMTMWPFLLDVDAMDDGRVFLG